MTTNRVVWLDCGMLPIEVAFCPSEAIWKREAKRLGLPLEPYPEHTACATDFTNSGRLTAVLVTVLEDADPHYRRNPGRLFGILCHEAVHVWQTACKEMQEKEPSHEFEAYTVQHLAEQLFDAYRKTRGAKPKARKSKRKGK